MRKLSWLPALAVVLLASRAWSQSDFAPQEPQTPAQDRWFSYELNERAQAGNQDYRSSDTNLFIGLPLSFNLTGDFNWFEDDTTSATPTISFGAGKDWDLASLGATYVIQTLANDFESNGVDIKGSIHTNSDDFRTTGSLDVAVTHEFEYLHRPKITNQLEITERVPTATLRQQFYGTRLSVSLTQYGYNKDPAAVAAAINRDSRLLRNVDLSGLQGLASGFADWADKFGIYQDVGAAATLWATYQNIKFIDTVFSNNQTLDSYTVGADYDIAKAVTVTAQYNYLRETGQNPFDIYGLNAALRF